MNTWITKFKLWRLAQQAKPSRVFVRSLERRLLPKMQQSFWIKWKVILASFGTLMSFGLGTVAYAYQSDTVLPDHFLYPIRSSIENIQLSLASPQDVPTLKLKQLRRRMQETELMSKRGRVLPSQNAKAVLKELHTVTEPEKEVVGTSKEKDSAELKGAEEEGDQIAEKQVKESLKEVLRTEKRELSEILEQQDEVETPGDKQEMNQMLMKQAHDINEDLGSLEESERD